jgi:DNA polymerase I-like protein with 3'-5' exonuclease and polymerase domains
VQLASLDTEFYWREGARQWDFTEVEVLCAVLRLDDGTEVRACPMLGRPFSVLQDWLSRDDLVVAAHHLAAEWHILRRLQLPLPRHLLDTEVAARFVHIRDEGFLHSKYDLLSCLRREGFAARDNWLKDEMRARIIRRDFSNLRSIVDYCGDDAADTLKLARKLTSKLDAHFWQLIQPLQLLLLEIHDNGLYLDTESYTQLHEHAEEILCQQQRRLCDLGFQGQFNDFEKLTSRAQNVAVQRTLEVIGLRDILDELPVYLQDVKRLGWQRRSMAGLFKSSHHRNLFLKAASEYHSTLDILRYDWRRFLDGDSRLRFGFVFPGTSSYRISPRQPHPLQLPKLFRPVLMAKDKEAIIEIDYSCQECGLAAQWFGDSALLQLFNKYRLCLYSEVGLRMGHYPDDNPRTDPAQRERIKISTLSMIYGAGANGLHGNLQCSEDEAIRILRAFHNSFPELFVGRDRYLNAVRSRGVAWNVINLARHYECFRLTEVGAIDTSLSFLNYPIQSGGAALMARLLMEMPKWIRIVAPCHDSVLLHCPEDAVHDVIQTASALMKQVMDDLFPGVRSRVKAQAAQRFYKSSPSSLHDFCNGLGVRLSAPVGWKWEATDS